MLMLKLYELDVHGEEGTGCRLLGLWPSAPLCELLRTEGFGFSSTGNLQGQFSLLSYRSGWPVQQKLIYTPASPLWQDSSEGDEEIEVGRRFHSETGLGKI